MNTNVAASTAEQILDLACELAQTRGYNAFSYRDLAREIGIRSASIHHHFPTKADLGKAMIQRYRERFADMLEEIDRAANGPADKLRAFLGLYQHTVRSEGGVCLGGMFAAEQLTLAPEIQTELCAFFTDGEAWLQEVLAAGAESGEITVTGSPKDAAAAIIGALQGAMMVARAHDDRESFDRTRRWIEELHLGS